MVHPKYRADIDGLRSVAILMVVLYHAFPETIKSGYIGVDVFFVISGFLISTIIFSSVELNRFDIVQFYQRRIARIFPALILIMIASIAIGWFVLIGPEYKELGKHLMGGATFVSNFILRQESGYFDTPSETKPLLHLWSLAIEEQFYIFWPLIITLIWKVKWSFLKISLVIGVTSFVYNIALIDSDPESAFYLPFSRFWELMLGSVLAYLVLYKTEKISFHRDLQSAIGFIFLTTAVILFGDFLAYPGWWALLPTLGSMLIISAGPHAWLNQKLLANHIMVWIGLISYPLYLWHWVLLTYLKIEEYGSPSSVNRMAAICVSFLLAWLTYKFVETPVRSRKDQLFMTKNLLILMLVVFIAGFLLVKENGFGKWKGTQEMQEYIDYFENESPEWNYYARTGMPEKYRFDCNFYDIEKSRRGKARMIPRPGISSSCHTRDFRYKKSVFIWGDSHAQHLYFGISEYIPADWQLLMVSTSGAVPDPHMEHPSMTNYMDHSNWFALKTIREARPDVVVLGQNQGHSLKKMGELTAKLKEMGVKKIVFTGPVPHWHPDLPKLVVKKMWYNTPRRTFVGVDQSFIDHDMKIKQGFRQREDVVYASLIDLFCNQDGCLTYLGEDKKSGSVTWDYGHLTPEASRHVARELLVDIIVSADSIGH